MINGLGVGVAVGCIGAIHRWLVCFLRLFTERELAV